VAGDYRFMGAPDHTVALGLSGDLSLGRVFDVQYRLDYNWRSDLFGSNTTDAGVYRIPSYGLLSASLSREFDVARGSLRATFWGSNLMDADHLLYHFNAGAGGPIPSAVWGEPRTLGLTLRLDL
jgi:outer membrane receptor protein involved in Fe transport